MAQYDEMLCKAVEIAQDYLKDPEHWTQSGVYVKHPRLEPTLPKMAERPEEVFDGEYPVCAVGALAYGVYRAGFPTALDRLKAIRRLRQVAQGLLEKSDKLYVGHLTEWNDKETVTHEDVLQVMAMTRADVCLTDRS